MYITYDACVTKIITEDDTDRDELLNILTSLTILDIDISISNSLIEACPFCYRKNDNTYLYKFDDQDNFLLGTGLLPRLCNELNIDNPISNKEIDNKDIDLRDDLRSYQKEAIFAAINKKNGLIKMPTGSGKSYVIGAIANYYLEKKVPILITISNRALLHQMYNDLVNYGINPDFIGRMGDSYKEFNKPLLLGIPDTLILNRDILVNANISVWLADEVHTLSNPTGAKISDMLRHTQSRIGLSATPWSNNGMNLLLEATFGPFIYEMHELNAMDQGVVMKPRIMMIYSPKSWAPISLINKSYSHYIYNRLYNLLIVHNKGRSRLIAEIASNYMDMKLAPMAIVVGRVNAKNNQPEEILYYLRDYGYDIPVIHGKNKSSEVSTVLNGLREFSIKGAIFGPGILKEGINIKNLGCLIMAGAGTSDISLIQRVGRVLRTNDDKVTPIIIDFIDQQSFFLKQSNKRMDTYESVYGRVEIIKDKKDICFTP